MKRILSGPLVVFFALLAFSAPGSTKSGEVSGEIKKADQYCSEIDKAVDKKILPTRIFANTGGEDRPDKWKEFKSLKSRDKGCEDGCTEYAVACFKDGKLVFVDNYFSGEDSSFDMTYYFRPDGSAVKIKSGYRQFEAESEEVQGDFVVDIEQVRYYDPQGNYLKKPFVQYSEVKTNQKLKKVKGIWMKEKDWAELFYTNIQKLPFYLLMKN
jgi:hypothetical protein